MEEQHLAKWNKVWRKIGTDKPLGNTLTLTGKEKISDYEQILKPKKIPKKEPFAYTENKIK